MKTETLEVYSDASNAAIIRHPSRRFPGMLIQGDSLNNLSGLAASALAQAERGSDLWYDLKELADNLQSCVDFYAKVMREHGLELPF
jgi:hypothetical protein